MTPTIIRSSLFKKIILEYWKILKNLIYCRVKWFNYIVINIVLKSFKCNENTNRFCIQAECLHYVNKYIIYKFCDNKFVSYMFFKTFFFFNCILSTIKNIFCYLIHISKLHQFNHRYTTTPEYHQSTNDKDYVRSHVANGIHPTHTVLDN